MGFRGSEFKVNFDCKDFGEEQETMKVQPALRIKEIMLKHSKYIQHLINYQQKSKRGTRFNIYKYCIHLNQFTFSASLIVVVIWGYFSFSLYYTFGRVSAKTEKKKSVACNYEIKQSYLFVLYQQGQKREDSCHDSRRNWRAASIFNPVKSSLNFLSFWKVSVTACGFTRLCLNWLKLRTMKTNRSHPSLSVIDVRSEPLLLCVYLGITG